MQTQVDSTGFYRYASLKIAVLGVTLRREVFNADLLKLTGPLLPSRESRGHFQQNKL